MVIYAAATASKCLSVISCLHSATTTIDGNVRVDPVVHAVSHIDIGLRPGWIFRPCGRFYCGNVSRTGGAVVLTSKSMTNE